jgi:leucyl-tRNA synthetase
MPYDFKSIEPKWQKHWEETCLYKAPETPRKKFYCLEMFAYPSGDIHMGHFRNYAIGDVLARYKMMQGYDLFHPFGWDAFGLPAEQAAIQRGIHPREWTLNNIEASRNTLKKVGLSYDWDKEVITCNPDYYKWNQWIFIRLFEKDLAYRAKSLVNWCPGCQTVLANEQVENGCCWRCESEVTKKELDQWFLRITAYADRLLADLDRLPGWPENVKTMQRNWIGRSEGVEIDFILEKTGQKLTVFTTRPDTTFGVTFMSIAPEHRLLREVELPDGHKSGVKEYISRSLKRSEIERTAVTGEKEGVFTGLYAINPLSNEKVQLWVADYVLATYGTGLVMGVPAHDQRDFLFAKKYGLPIKVVIQPPAAGLSVQSMGAAYEEPGTMENSGEFDGLQSDRGITRVIEQLEKKGLGRRKINYKLRDWLVSRQRYWGTPIPVIHCSKCGIVPVPDKNLPVVLPDKVTDFLPKGRSPLEDLPEFINVSCPKCHSLARRDPDTMDTFVDSSWYQHRYVDNRNDKEIFNRKKTARWQPVDKYIGGITHATGHLLYFRFFNKFFKDLGILDLDEPATELFNHGMVLDSKGEVMSKSKGNVVTPLEVMARHGVDTTRTAILFAAPPGKELLWSDEGLTGAGRFLNRLFRLVEATGRKPIDLNSQFKLSELSDIDAAAYRKLNWAIKKVTDDIESLEFNTAIAALMELLNQLTGTDQGKPQLLSYSLAKMTQLLAPFAPHIAEELWTLLGYKDSVFRSSWPAFDPEAIQADEVTYAVQINGKLRATFDAPVNISEAELKKLVLSQEKVTHFLKEREILKTIVVPNKLVNLVVK